MPNRTGHKCFIVWAISSCLEMEEWRLYSQVFKQEEKRDALWPRISVGKSITCPPGFSPWEVEGGIGNFRPFIWGAWIYRKWSSQNLEWEMNKLREPGRTCLFLARLRADGKPEKGEDRCLPPWNLTDKDLFQSFLRSDSLGIWV